MKIGAQKIAELNEFLSKTTPKGGEMHTEVIFKEGEETIKIDLDDAKPKNVCSHQEIQEENASSQTIFEKLRVCSVVLDGYTQEYYKRLTDLMPPEAEEISSKTTMKVGRVFINFELSAKRNKSEMENIHKRKDTPIDDGSLKEPEVKKRKLEKQFRI